jgi:hypothetical protein
MAAVSPWSLAFFAEPEANLMAIKLGIESQGRKLTDEDVELATRIARERAALMKRLKGALVAHDDKQALAIAREACGLGPEEPKQ